MLLWHLKSGYFDPPAPATVIQIKGHYLLAKARQGSIRILSHIDIRVLHPLQLYPSHFISSRSHLLWPRIK